jgi:ADP-ribose pyrophosphatase YjhB (NUDIX family)
MPRELPTTQLYADEFLESCGAVTFNHKDDICVIYNPRNKEYNLPKGRRSCNESRTRAAIREFSEETGYGCILLPVTMATRAPPDPEEHGYKSLRAVERENLVDPFALSIREEGMGRKKLIWWYIAVETKEWDKKYQPTEEDLKREAKWISIERAVELLPFKTDRELVQEAQKIYQDNKT